MILVIGALPSFGKGGEFLPEHPGSYHQNPAVNALTRGIYWSGEFLGNSGIYSLGSTFSFPFILDSRLFFAGTKDSPGQESSKGTIGITRSFQLNNRFADSLLVGLNGLLPGVLWYLPEERTPFADVVLGSYVRETTSDKLDLELEGRVGLFDKHVDLLWSMGSMRNTTTFTWLNYPVVRNFHRIGVRFNPNEWFSLTYSLLHGGNQEYRMSADIQREGVFSTIGFDLYGYYTEGHSSSRIRRSSQSNLYSTSTLFDERDYGVGVSVRLGLFGGYLKNSHNESVSLVDYYLDKSESEEERLLEKSAGGTFTQADSAEHYNQYKVGIMRGWVLPILNTWTLYGTLFIPAGTNNLLMGNTQTGLMFLAGWSATATLFIYTKSQSVDSPELDSFLFLTAVGLKIWDFFVARSFASEHNEQLQLKIAPLVNGEKIGAEAIIAF
ncbi:MAG: hypothetical protein OCD01_14555 [Fibrobacterales bacterium]